MTPVPNAAVSPSPSAGSYTENNMVNGSAGGPGGVKWDEKFKLPGTETTTTLKEQFMRQIVMTSIQQMQPMMDKMKEAIRENEF